MSTNQTCINAQIFTCVYKNFGVIIMSTHWTASQPSLLQWSISTCVSKIVDPEYHTRGARWAHKTNISAVCPIPRTSRPTYTAGHAAYRCMNGTAPRYLGSELQRIADIESRRRLRSASSPSLHVPRSLHRTIGDRAFPVAAAKVWNALPPAITSLPSLRAFKRALKTELFRRSYGNANYRPQQHWHYSCSVIRDT